MADINETHVHSQECTGNHREPAIQAAIDKMPDVNQEEAHTASLALIAHMLKLGGDEMELEHRNLKIGGTLLGTYKVKIIQDD
jgi:hypothetical protein